MGYNKNLPSIFEGYELRKIWHNDEWYFSVVDIIKILTESPTPRQYWGKIKDREFTKNKLSPIWVQLKLTSSDNKKYNTDCANFQSSLRIIQSIPSKRAEPFKLWLASLGQAEIYRQQGYDENWIEQRMKSKLARYEITGEWQKRGITFPYDFAILTNTIHKKTFDKTIHTHKKFKNLSKRKNLRDNMTDLELMFSALGERIAKEITTERNSEGLNECKNSAKEGGEVAGNARRDAEKRLNKSIVSKKNKKDIIKNNKILEN